ncbi:hypothetical protein OKC48_07260 [Methylorubrum extorquens]|uniref:hypothetical protein n=1 Tax=Methylorubrum extorquens TaxID=408 RepID=UPI0022388ED4|nr:hypothetical protein [Methylorubrum extorquens]UYW28305.1 hypothetical protein OKC48_07260 [Methylorubrum extorquens]
MATLVIGGLISATVLSLLVLPALYARFGKVAVTKAAERLLETAQSHLKVAE